MLPLGFLDGAGVKNLPANARDAGSIPGLGGSPGEGNGNSLQYSCLENSMDRGGWWATVHGVAKSRIRTEHVAFATNVIRCFLNIYWSKCDSFLVCCVWVSFMFANLFSGDMLIIKLQQERFTVDVRKNSFTARGIICWKASQILSKVSNGTTLVRLPEKSPWCSLCVPQVGNASLKPGGTPGVVLDTTASLSKWGLILPVMVIIYECEGEGGKGQGKELSWRSGGRKRAGN